MALALKDYKAIEIPWNLLELDSIHKIRDNVFERAVELGLGLAITRSIVSHFAIAYRDQKVNIPILTLGNIRLTIGGLTHIFDGEISRNCNIKLNMTKV